ncbi:MAG: glycosyltransferase family 2 protein [Simkaniaceae bacterium]|nr:MAG: glycosyltransferase family 2 protein [Simkaniaceae bacterium]
MKRFFFIFILFAIGFVLGFGYREVKAEINAKREAKQNHTTYATQPVIEKKSFVVIVLAKDNASHCEQNLLSVLSQDYEDFRVIYIENNSKDQTGAKARTFLRNQDINGKVDFIKYGEEACEGETLYRAIHSCQNHEIIVLLRGDEFFAQNGVLEKLNRYFADPDVWMTASDILLYPTYCKVNRNSYYQAFYTGLFKRMKLEEFLIDGKFRKGHYEEILYPALKEIAGNHAYGIGEPLFICQKERELPSNERKACYSVMKGNPWHDFSKDEERVDLLVFSYNRPLQLYALLESSEKYLENLHRLYVIYRAGNDHYEKGYHKVKKAFPNAIYIRQSIENPYEDFAPTVRKTIFDTDVSTARYITFALDDFIIKESLDLNESARLLKETGAYGFYFCLGNHLKTHPKESKILIQEGVYGWQFSSMEGEWQTPNSVKMTLFKKEDIYPDFLNMKFHNPNILQALWNESADLSRVGLYYDRSKAVNLPLNIVMENEWVQEKVTNISTKELLSFFDQGLKMDIAPLDHFENQTVEVDFEPEFTKR